MELKGRGVVAIAEREIGERLWVGSEPITLPDHERVAKTRIRRVVYILRVPGDYHPELAKGQELFEHYRMESVQLNFEPSGLSAEADRMASLFLFHDMAYNLIEEGSRTLLCCKHGNTAALVAVGYLIKKRRLSLEKAKSLVNQSIALALGFTPKVSVLPGCLRPNDLGLEALAERYSRSDRTREKHHELTEA